MPMSGAYLWAGHLRQLEQVVVVEEEGAGLEELQGEEL